MQREKSKISVLIHHIISYFVKSGDGLSYLVMSEGLPDPVVSPCTGARGLVGLHRGVRSGDQVAQALLRSHC